MLKNFAMPLVLGYSLDLSRLSIGGYSAGGQLALLYSLNQGLYRDPSCCDAAPSPNIKKVISIAGPTDFETIDFSATGYTCDILPGPVQWQYDDAFLDPTSLTKKKAASPLTYVYSNNPAKLTSEYLLLYSDADSFVDFGSQAVNFYGDMVTNAFNFQNIWYSGFDHDFADSGAAINNVAQVKIDMLNFLNN
jgi:hypothetical protein